MRGIIESEVNSMKELYEKEEDFKCLAIMVNKRVSAKFFCD